jgi:hypothetical protein
MASGDDPTAPISQRACCRGRLLIAFHGTWLESGGQRRAETAAARGSQRHTIPAAIAPFSSRRVGSVSVRSGEHIGSAVHARLEDHGTAALVQRPPSARSGHGHDRRVRHRIGVVGQRAEGRGSIEAGVSGRCQHEDDSPHPAKRRARPLAASPDTSAPQHAHAGALSSAAPARHNSLNPSPSTWTALSSPRACRDETLDICRRAHLCLGCRHDVASTAATASRMESPAARCLSP